MLVITGSVKGQQYVDKIVSAKELCEIIGVPYRKSIQVEFTRERRKKDQFNQERAPSSFNSTCEIHGIVDGESLTIRYAKGRKNNPTGSGFIYNPTRIGFKGQIGSFGEKTVEEGLFLSLHPVCKQSPFYSGRQPVLEVIDYETENKKKLESLEQERQLGNTILQMDINALRLRAKGLIVGGRQFSGVGQMDDYTLRMTLMDWLRKDAINFSRAWNDAGTELRAVLQEALDRGFISPFAQNGRTGFVWSAQEGGGEILIHPSSEQPMSALYRYASENYDVFVLRLVSLIGSAQASTSVQLPGDPSVKSHALKDLEALSTNHDTVAGLIALDSEKLTELALVQEKIEFDRNSLEVWTIAPNGTRKNSIFVATSVAAWKFEFSKFLDESAEVKRGISMSIINALKKK